MMVIETMRKFLSALRAWFAGTVLGRAIWGNENYYINGADVLPPPLSAEEEADAIARLGLDESAVALLIEHNLRLVVYIARKFENTGIGLEDLISIGTIGLIKGISSFDGSKGARLATYAARCIENAILSPMGFRLESVPL